MSDLYSKILVVNGLPAVTDATKFMKLKKVVFDQLLKDREVYPETYNMPFLKKGASFKSFGIFVIEFKTVAAAKRAQAELHQKVFLGNITLNASLRKDYFETKDTPDEVPPFDHTEYSAPAPFDWLLDQRARSMFFAHAKTTLSLAYYDPSRQVELQKRLPLDSHSNLRVGWTPRGRYLYEIQENALALRNGDDFSISHFLEHPDLKYGEFSPDERFACTVTDPCLKNALACIWDVEFGHMLKQIPLCYLDPRKGDVPFSKISFSANGRFFSRFLEDSHLEIYEIKGGENALIARIEQEKGKKARQEFIDQSFFHHRLPHEVPLCAVKDADIVKLPKLKVVSWSPCGNIMLTFQNSNGSLPASFTFHNWAKREQKERRFAMRNVAKVISDPDKPVRIFWHPSGEFCVAHLYRTGERKDDVLQTLLVFRIQKRTVDQEMIEFYSTKEAFDLSKGKSDNLVVAKAKTRGRRRKRQQTVFFDKPSLLEDTVTLGGVAEEALNISFCASEPTMAVTTDKVVHFYDLGDKSEGKTKFISEVELRGCSAVKFSPAGRHVALIDSNNEGILFYDLKDTRLGARVDNFGMKKAVWDDTGRYLASWCPEDEFSQQHIIIMSYTGSELYNQTVTSLRNFQWRPVPKTMLSDKEQRDAYVRLKSVHEKYLREDKMVSGSRLDAESARREIEWADWGKHLEKMEYMKKKFAEEYARLEEREKIK
ncbi:Eukaryotic translation initiation factor 3 subunit B like protein [Aduncisulcus paluster]|uniref:Eukaryotic translation initiation factor 3 subunit B like protein n=1 Tax=Aduncisulcus paluster TaxID=2918883 RepID=A0ABQ5K1P6_9EUKA|nr:Eukaryotic translation initiation factor 3 subunit B like protein [Aduncisulcus paluster]|eukprot:gnl/Carplike_NY0171/1927_a2607_849.p1 GENE.gnl/Carplike_NY0171/1927_a2607_849~~gnl/Carplike_NY0171/1927_a2607_849.p1  ORF type:complete len:712 (-),score=206.24 gnl/Carplike_NY0171/1927_a2607_849:109-2244(-)